MLDKKKHQIFFCVKTLYYLNTIISFMKDSFFLRKAKEERRSNWPSNIRRHSLRVLSTLSFLFYVAF